MECSDYNNLSESQVDCLRKINDIISKDLEIEETIDNIFEELLQFTKSDRIEIGFLEDNNQRLIIYQVRTNYDEVILTKDSAIDINLSFYKQALIDKTVVTMNDLENDKDLINYDSTKLLLKEKIQSLLICPVIHGNKKIGVLTVASRNKNKFDEKINDFFVILLNDIFSFLERTWNLEQVNKLTNTYMEMLSVISHEMKSPLASIITLGKTLSDGYFGSLEDKHKEVIDRMIRKAEYMHALSNEYLSLSRFESGDLQIQEKLVDFTNEILEPAIDLVMPQIEEKKIEFIQDYEEKVYPINCDPDLVRVVLINLLSNAVKYGNKKGKVKLAIEYKFKRILVRVWNEGIGFPESEQKKLFRKFSRLDIKELKEKKGTGVGLYISWKIVQLHGGKIKASSKYGEWAEFYFELPQYMDLCII